MNGYKRNVNFSGYTPAKYFGVISPKINTDNVITTVETVVASSDELISSFVNNTVPSAEAVKFTILFPIRIVVISLSYFSSASLYTCFAFFLPSAIMLLILILFAHEYAVSVAENNPEKITNTTIAIVRGTILFFLFLRERA